MISKILEKEEGELGVLERGCNFKGDGHDGLSWNQDIWRKTKRGEGMSILGEGKSLQKPSGGNTSGIFNNWLGGQCGLSRKNKDSSSRWVWKDKSHCITCRLF